MTAKEVQRLAKEHGTPVVIIDHDVIRKNYAEFKKHLPKVQAYYAVKANPAPEIVRTLYKAGASFDVASLPEFMTGVRKYRGPCRPKRSRISFGTKSFTPIRRSRRRRCWSLDQYKPLVTYDNLTELEKIRKYAPHAGVVLRLRVANTGSQWSSSRTNSAATRAKRWI